MIKLLTKEYEKEWTNYINSKEISNPYCSLEWKSIIQETYSYEPYYFIALKDNRIVGVLPLFLVNKKLTQNPFGYYSSIIADNELIMDDLMVGAIKMGTNLNVKYVEFKPVEKIDLEMGLIEKTPFFISDLKLFPTYEETRKNYKKVIKKRIRSCKERIQKDGIILKCTDEENDLKRFHNFLIKLYRDKFKMLCGSYKIFYNIFRKNLSRLYLMEKDDKIIAGLFMIFYKDNVSVLYCMFKDKYKWYSPSLLLFDEAIKWSIENKIKVFSFGCTSPSQTDLLVFKDKWGCETKKLYYYYYTIKSEKIPDFDYDISYSFLRNIYRFIPIPIIKMFLYPITRRLG